MYRLIRVDSEANTHDFGLWISHRRAIRNALTRLSDKWGDDPPGIGWVVEEQGPEGGRHYYNPTMTEPVLPFVYYKKSRLSS